MFILLAGNCFAVDAMGDTYESFESTTAGPIHSSVDPSNDSLGAEAVRSIFEYHDNQWTSERIDALNTKEIVQCFEELVWQGDGDIRNIVQSMMHRNILSNNNRGFGELVLNSEVQLKDYLKEQVAEIQDRQQADRVQQETDQ